MKVNMTPNPLDVVTIHASQGDTEARQWEFELHNNGELIDTSEVTEQMFFKAYKGGTEQLLPENGSTPTTSPFKGDIKYPQGLLTDQEFTYRQSPTEEDGNAKIKNLYGNTLVWNQLVQNTSSTWSSNSNNHVSVSFDANTNTVTITGLQGNTIGRGYTVAPTQQNHKYLICSIVKTSVSGYVLFEFSRGWVGKQTQVSANTETYISFLLTPTSATDSQNRMQVCMTQNGEYVLTCKNTMCFDLTAIGLDSITDPSEFTSLFPLSYYSYNQGSLLSFNGNGIKTVGKNLCTRTNQNSNIYNAGNLIRVKQGQTIYWGGVWTYTSSGGKFWPAVYSDPNETNKSNFISYGGSDPSGVVNSYTVQKDGYLGLAYADGVSSYNVEKMMISYAPFTIDEIVDYTSSTTSLPISTYFPTGMKSAGNVYDELTPTKAITRVGAVDLGTLNWTYSSITGHLYFNSNDINTLVKKASAPSTYANIVCQKYNVINENEAYSNRKVGIGITTNGSVRVYDPTYTNVADFKTAMSGVYLYYELATSTETSFTTASLVTENAEIPLSNEDGTLIGKCTEELSENPGFFDAKIKLADADGECYSNKLQLHVERSPQ